MSLQAEAARVAEDSSLSPAQRQALLASRYQTLMAPAVVLLERQLRATAAAAAETPHERRFAATVLPRLRAAAAALRDPEGAAAAAAVVGGAGTAAPSAPVVRDWARPVAAWAPLRAAAAALSRSQRDPLPPLAELSPALAALNDTEVPMPGLADGDGADGGSGYGVPATWALSAASGDALPHPGAAFSAAAAAAAAGAGGPGAGGVSVAGVSSEVTALATKTRPKRVALLGSDGGSYGFLLKGREDLRMDERLMQVRSRGGVGRCGSRPKDPASALCSHIARCLNAIHDSCLYRPASRLLGLADVLAPPAHRCCAPRGRCCPRTRTAPRAGWRAVCGPTA